MVHFMLRSILSQIFKEVVLKSSGGDSHKNKKGIMLGLSAQSLHILTFKSLRLAVTLCNFDMKRRVKTMISITIIYF